MSTGDGSASSLSALRRKLESEKRVHATTKAFGDLAVKERNAAWAEIEKVRRDAWRDTESLKEQVKIQQLVIRKLTEDGGSPPPLYGGRGWTPAMINAFDEATRER